jgi:membrane-bound lytic murein transglycosylase MltF
VKIENKTLGLVLILGLVACSGGDAVQPGPPDSADDQDLAQQPIPAEPPAIPAEPPALVAEMLEPFHGDFDAMVEEREIRVLVTYNRTNFFLDGGTQRGITADALREFEKALNKELKLRKRPLHIAAIPVLHEQLIPYLEAGRGDIAIASLSITPERAERVVFSEPTARDVSELVVTGPDSPAVTGIDDLSGKRVVVRSSSSYIDSLAALNASFRDRGMEEIEIAEANEYLETEDLLEMVNAGLIEITVADSYFARFWSQVLPDIVVHEDLAVATGRSLGWALRPDATGLKEHVDRFVRANRKGSLLGNTLLNRYLKSTKWVERALSPEYRQRLDEVIDLFREFGGRYDFDYLMVAAQAYQESKFNQDLVSRAGAVGVMQLLPSTAADKSVGIPDITTIENNIHAGAKYLRYIVDHYFDDPDIDEVNRTLFAFASYNAGPNRIRRLRAKAADQGYDPNVWFRNVEVVVSNEVGREPVEYVRNIFKYYTAYALLSEQDEMRQEAIAETHGEN